MVFFLLLLSIYRFLLACILVVCPLCVKGDAQIENLDSCDIFAANSQMTIVQMQNSCSGNQSTGYLLFKNSSLPTLPDVFGAFPKLRSLEASSSNVIRIDNGTFTKAGNLQTVHLFNNTISRIYANTFSRTHTLEVLNLASNHISTIELHAFSGLSMLQNLDLSSNDLKAIDEGVFQPLAKLRTIRLTSNKIGIIDETVFHSNQDLRTIYLDKNEIIVISNNAFQLIRSPNILDLSDNQINGDDFLRHINKVKQVNLSNCNLTTLYIPNSATAVFASNNKITHLQTPVNAVVETLYLVNNSLSHLEDIYMLNLSMVEILDVSYNQITNIDFSKMTNFTSLRQLALVGNKIATLNITNIKKLLPKLKAFEVSTDSFNSSYTAELCIQLGSQEVYLMDGNRVIINAQYVSSMDKSIQRLIEHPDVMADGPGLQNGSKPINKPVSAPISAPANEPGNNGTNEKVTAFLNTELAKIRQKLFTVESLLNTTIANMSTENLANLTETLLRRHEDAMKLLDATQIHVNGKENIESDVRHIKSIVIFFIILLCGFAIFKVGIFVRRNYFSTVVIRNPLHTRSMSSDSFNPIFEDRL